MREAETFTLKHLFAPNRRASLIGAVALLATSYVVEHFANVYAFAYSARATSNHVGDLLLDNLPVLDLSFLVVEGAFLFIVLCTVFVLSKPKYALFTAKTVALFIITRAFFTSLTHVGIYPEHVMPGLGFFDSIYLYLNFQTGLFFSGHTGLPVLMALIFWHNRRARIASLIVSFVAGASVLLAHIHYSIDVFAAPFMAYGIFTVATYLFRRDYELIGEERLHFPRP